MHKFPTHIHTFVDLLRFRAAHEADQPAYLLLPDGESREIRLTYDELDRKARAVAVALQRRGMGAERILLLYPYGLEYIEAFFGCLYAGAVAVPAYPPDFGRQRSALARIRAIATNAQASLALTTAAILAKNGPALRQDQDFQAIEVLATDTLSDASAGEWRSPGETANTLAMLQYTSGSTATPKGVMITHGNLLSNQQMIQAAIHHPARAPYVSWLPLYHDMGLIGNVLQALYVDAPCVLLPPAAFLQRPVRWLQAISRYRGHTSGGPNFAYDLCARRISADQRATLDLGCWRIAFNGSEPIRQESLQNFLTLFAPCHFKPEAWYPVYGLAEATVFVTGGRAGTPPTVSRVETPPQVMQPSAEFAHSGVHLGCGRAWLEERLLIVDPERHTACSPGQVGEIWLAGPHVARGYWNNQEATRHTFGALLNTGEGPFLRTGDLGFLKGEELFVTGRIKDLIILRGLNYYPQDIELTVERCHPCLCPLACAAFAVPVQSAERLVVVQEVERHASEEDLAAASAEIRARIASEHGLATHAIVLIRANTLPKTTSGKLQRAETRRRFLATDLEVVCQSICAESGPDEDSDWLYLSGPLVRATAADRRQGEIERYLQAHMARLTGHRAASIDWRQPVGALGLDSLTSMELKHQVETDLEVLLPLEELFRGWTLSQLAGAIATLCEQEPVCMDESAIALRPAEELCGTYPLSSMQRGLWFLAQLRPASNEHHLAFCLQICGPLDVACLQHALNAIVARHGVLRATIAEREGTAEMLIHPYRQVHLPVEECPFATEEACAEAVRQRAQAEAGRPFDLQHGPLCRFLLLRVSGDEHILCVNVHHLVFDGWSLGVFVRELSAGYLAASSGQSCELPPLPTHYGEYVAWQRKWQHSEEYTRQLAYWQRQLAGLPAALHLPTDHPRPALRSLRGARHSFVIAPELLAQLRQYARREQTTLFPLLLAAFQLLLFRYSGQRDIIVGTPVSGRRQAILKDVIGCFVNLLAIRSVCSAGADFASVLHGVRATLLEAYARADVPFEAVVEALGPERDLSRPPVFQVTCAMQTIPLPTGQAETITISPAEVASGSVQYDLSLAFLETPGALQARLDYASDLFELPTIQRFVQHFQHLLQGIVASPHRRIGDMALLAPDEQKHLVTRWQCATAAAATGRCLPQLCETWAQRTPAAVALVCGEQHLSYGELHTRANRLAHVLQQLGVGPEKVVAVCMHRSFELVIALLAVLKAGGAYLPLDPVYPRKRLAFMLEDAGVSVVLTLERLREYLVQQNVPLLCLDGEWGDRTRVPAAPPTSGLQVENLACVIYTSGSTGRPRGVHVTQRGLCNLIGWHRRVFALTARDRTTQLASWSFDAAGWELWPSLAAGATIHLADDELRGDPPRLCAWLEEQQVTQCFVPTPLAESMLAEGQAPAASLRTLLTGGDLLHHGPLHPLPCVLVNNYGPTENTVVTTSGIVEAEPGPGRAPSIGCPIDNVRVYVLDICGQPAPVGVVGELYIGGASLARGYGHLAELTAERFVPDPFSGEAGARLYRTGDLVRWLPDGRLAFVGRVDQQVKICGMRIELGEIERALQELADVRAAAVVVREDRPAHRTLVAYVVPAGPEPDPQALRRQLRTQLPDYMVPTGVVLLEALPLTPNGKLDRRALPAPRLQRTRRFVAPRTPTEEILAALWCELLGISQVSSDESFLEAGGHSLLATRAIAHIRQIFQVDLSVQCFFEARSLAELAELLTASQPAQETLRILAELADEIEHLTEADVEQRLRAIQGQAEGGHAHGDI